MNTKRLIFVSIFVISAFSHAQEDLNVRDPRMNEGKLFTLQYTPGSKRLVVSAAGKPAMVLGPDRIVVFGREITGKGKSMRLRIQPSEGSFIILDDIQPTAPIEIDVQDRTTKKKETIKIEQHQP